MLSIGNGIRDEDDRPVGDHSLIHVGPGSLVIGPWGTLGCALGLSSAKMTFILGPARPTIFAMDADSQTRCEALLDTPVASLDNPIPAEDFGEYTRKVLAELLNIIATLVTTEKTALVHSVG